MLFVFSSVLASTANIILRMNISVSMKPVFYLLTFHIVGLHHDKAMGPDKVKTPVLQIQIY